MARVIFKKNKQSKFLEKVKFTSGLSTEKLASICNVCNRTFKDWSKGKFNISYKALLILVKKVNLPLPKDIRIVEDYWYVKKGARKGVLRRIQLYGGIGTPEGRKKGGIVSQVRRKENPEKYRLLGCNVRKDFKINNSSVKFTEAAGIILGDGAITNNQIRITSSGLFDREYAMFICDLFEEVFKERPHWWEYKVDNTIELLLSGINLVEELERWGFVRGNKIDHQVDFPGWIWKKSEYQKACVIDGHRRWLLFS